MKLITRHTDYAVSAICHIATKTDPVTTADVCRELGMPFAFMRGILQKLQKQGILDSSKGKAGGFSLARTLRDISLFDVMTVFQDSFLTSGCVFRKHPCPRQKSCALRKKLERVHEVLRHELETVALSSLAP